MSLIRFLVFGSLSSMIGVILNTLTGLISMLFVPLSRKLAYVVGGIMSVFVWAVGVTTGVLIAEHYAGGTLSFVIYLILIMLFNNRVWVTFVKVSEEKRKSRFGMPRSHSNIQEMFNMMVGYSILIPLILFGIKPEWASPVFSFVFDMFKSFLPG